MVRPTARYVMQVLLLAGVYFAAGRLGLPFAETQENTTLVWPPTGIALAAVWLWRPRVWPGIALGSLLVNLTTGAHPLAVLAIVVGNTLEALAGVYLLRQAKFNPRLERVRDVLALVVLAALLSTTVSATVGVSAIWLTKPPPLATYGQVWLYWWLGDALGNLVVAPALLVWSGRPCLRWRPLEGAILIALLSLASLLIFGDWIPGRLRHLPLSYAVFPFLIWAALRFGPVGAVSASLLVLVLATGQSALGFGGFTQGEEGLLFLHAFLAAAAVTGMLLAAVLAERANTAEALRHSEARFRALIEGSFDVFNLVDEQVRFRYVSPGGRRVLGYEPEELAGRNGFEFLHPDDVGPSQQNLSRILQESDTVVSAEVQLRHKDGSWRWIEYIASNRLADPYLQAIVVNFRDITQRKQAEQANQESQRALSTLIGHLPGAAYRCRNDPEWTMEFISDGCRDLTGHAAAELLAGRVNWGKDVIHPDDQGPVWEQVQSAVQQWRPYQLVYRIRHAGGELRWVWEQGSGVFSPDGELRALEGFVTDITQQKQALEALQLRARQQAVVAEVGQRALVGASLAELMREVVEQTARTLDVEFVQVLRLLPGGEALHLDAGVGWKEGLVGQATVAAGPDFQAGFTLHSHEPVVVQDLNTETRFHGPPHLFEHGVVSGLSVIIAGQGQPFGVLGAHSTRRRTFTNDDIHFLQALANVLATAIQRKEAEDTLRASEERYRFLFERNLAGVIQTTTKGEILDCNDSFARMLGFASREEIMPHAMGEFYFHPADRERLLTDLREQAALSNHEILFRRRDGQPVWVLGNISLLIAERGEVMHGTAIDITERKRADEALREQERRYRTLVEHAPEAIVIFDYDSGHFVDANDNAVRLYGLPREQLYEVGPIEMSPPTQPDGRPSRESALEKIQEALQGGTPSFEWVHRNTAGELIPCEVRLVRLPSRDRNLIRGSVTDIRERKRLEEQLRQAQKLEAIGQLAGGVAHDFNNLLTIINGYADLMLEQAEPEHPWRPFIEEVQKAGDRAAALTRQLLAFSRKQMLQPAVLDLNQVIANIENLLRRLIGAHVELACRPAADLWPIKADRGQLEQVLMNLAVNARDAMPTGGRLTLTTANVLLDEAAVQARPEVQPGPYARLTVADTGCGMDEEVRSRVFEPFFTTKEVGKGTGLGLATVYGIVKQSGGHIELTSEPGRGSTFTIFLPPAAEAPVSAEPATDVSGELPRGSETVLLVEDEEAVRALARRVLLQQGYTVLDAPHGIEALALLGRHDGALHLVVTDVVMPEMDGPELVRRLTADRPNLRVLYISGYTDSAASRQSLAPAARLLKKPFPPAELVRMVREVLDGPG